MIRRHALGWLAAGGLLMGQLIIAAPKASAAPVNLSMRISRILQVENPDDASGDGDYFVRVKIGGNATETSPRVEDDDFRPNFVFTKSVDDGSPVVVTLELVDFDTGLNGEDDILDINPTDQAVTLTFTVNPATRTWTSPDLPNNALFARGDGDEDFPAVHDGKIAQIEFDFSVNGGADIDGDGIPDAVERFGVRDANGVFVAGGNFPGLGSDPCRKSIAVQLDYMTGAANGHSHQPSTAVINELVAAFNAAPTAAVVPCPYPGTHSPTGLDFVAIPGRSVPEQAVMGLGASFRTARNANFPAPLGPYAHYMIFVHDQASGSTSSGLCCEDERGNLDFIVSLGSWRSPCVGAGANGVMDTTPSGDDVATTSAPQIITGPDHTCNTTKAGDDTQDAAVGSVAALADVGTTRDQSGSVMHELGHAIGLGHGGNEGTNYKPNYLSVMNYSFDPGGIPTAAGSSRLDYSKGVLPALDKTLLSEAAGIGDGTDFTTWLDPSGTARFAIGNAAIDWNQDKTTNPGTVNEPQL
jgi:hypothetical protein